MLNFRTIFEGFKVEESAGFLMQKMLCSLKKTYLLVITDTIALFLLACKCIMFKCDNMCIIQIVAHKFMTLYSSFANAVKIDAFLVPALSTSVSLVCGAIFFHRPFRHFPFLVYKLRATTRKEFQERSN